MKTFVDRRTAGQVLVEALREYATDDTVVLGISRGGVIVAHEVAHLLHLPFDVLVMQRIAEPGYPHHSVGAIAESGHLVVQRRRLRELALTPVWLRQSVTHGLQQATHKARLYRAARQRQEVAGRQVILIDDSAATGTTLQAALKAVRTLGPREIIVAVPVAPTPVVDWLRGQVERVVCPCTPAQLIARGVYYPAPLQVTDEEIRDLLADQESRLDERS